MPTSLQNEPVARLFRYVKHIRARQPRVDVDSEDEGDYNDQRMVSTKVNTPPRRSAHSQAPPPPPPPAPRSTPHIQRVHRPYEKLELQVRVILPAIYMYISHS